MARRADAPLDRPRGTDAIDDSWHGSSRTAVRSVTQDMITSIAGHASSAAQLQQLGEQNIAVAKKVHDHQKIEGEAAVSLIETAGSVQQAPPTGDHTGRHVNLRV